MRSLLSAALMIAVAVGPAVVAPAVTAAAPPVAEEAAGHDEASEYTPVPPARVLDTRNGTGGVTGPVGPNRSISLDLSSRVPAGTTAVVLNVTGVAPTAATYVTAFPTGEARPLASNLNLARDEVRANLVTVRVGGDRAVSLYNYVGSTHLVADLAGYYSTGDGALFTPREAERVLSTSIGPRGTGVADVSWAVPESATAVVLNLTGTRGTSDTYLTAWPTGTARPVVSNVNVAAGRTTPNLVTVSLGADRKVSLFNNAGTIKVYADLAGFYSPEYGAKFTPVTPYRTLDTRTGEGVNALGPVGERESATWYPGTTVPDHATAVVLNVTGVSPTATTFVTAWQHTTAFGPGTSNLNLVAGQTAANLVVTPVLREDPRHRATFFNASGEINLVADLAGYFAVWHEQCLDECAYAWGANLGGLGTGSATSYEYFPSPIHRLTRVTAVADRYALRADGSVWSWGGNELGELGNGWEGGGEQPVTSPVPVLGLTDVTAVAAAVNTGLALRADGTVWGWGSNFQGLLGDVGPMVWTTPTQVQGLSEVTAIVSGRTTAYALRADGTVWAWGNNEHGQLGSGSSQGGSRIPVQVTGLTGVTSIAAGEHTGYAVLADGTVRSWGRNNTGQLGSGSTAAMSPVPVQVSGLTGVRMVAGDRVHGFALRVDGTVWGWGDNIYGGLGNGFECSLSPTNCLDYVPVQVSNLTGVVDIAAFGEGGYALGGDGRLWAWGDNSNQALGRVDGGWETTPVLVPNLPEIRALESGRSGGRVLAANP